MHGESAREAREGPAVTHRRALPFRVVRTASADYSAPKPTLRGDGSPIST